MTVHFIPTLPEGAPRLPVVLLVEDHLDTRQMYAEFLSSRFTILTAGDGREALDMMVVGHLPDLVITDLALPGMGGLELIAMMRQDEALRNVPVICMSGYGGHAIEQRAQVAGCDRILQKPCMPDALADAAEEVIRAFRDRARPS